MNRQVIKVQLALLPLWFVFGLLAGGLGRTGHVPSFTDYKLAVLDVAKSATSVFHTASDTEPAQPEASAEQKKLPSTVPAGQGVSMDAVPACIAPEGMRKVGEALDATAGDDKKAMAVFNDYVKKYECFLMQSTDGEGIKLVLVKQLGGPYSQGADKPKLYLIQARLAEVKISINHQRYDTVYFFTPFRVLDLGPNTNGPV